MALSDEWYKEAACDGADPDATLFFPPRDKELYKEIAAQAKEYCFGSETRLPCPVRLHCLWEAVSTDEQHGIWGGMSHRERNALVRKWQKQFRHKMTLKEYIFQLDNKDKK
jgi:WhiB family redox-sensing transcriptional regulator